MTHHYTLFVDEAGDDKINSLKPDDPSGNSEWLCLGGYLIKAEAEPDLPTRRDAIRLAIGGKPGEVLHFRDLKPKNRMIATRIICNEAYSARGYAVCSFKKTMIGYRNLRAERVMKGQHKDTLYNYLCRILLERVTQEVARHGKARGIKQLILRIVMASRRGHHFGELKAYIQKLIYQQRAGSTYQSTRTIDASVLRWELIERAPASVEPGLQLADTLVSAFFQSIEQASPHNADQPALYLKPLMAKRPTRYVGQRQKWNHEGVTLYVPEAAKYLSPAQAKFFESYGYNIDFLRTRKVQRKPHVKQAERIWGPTYGR